ncbi:response regulator transcription factor [Hyphomicrobium sp.]|uniref:response regulator transcription factor n=1 Tax=Hyphomicrobium sp. TaxID=82 RepID=UPI002E2F4D08|nr:response regulator [Hyphomicrobium sp.]HEX2841246.1 response regulator [Hyphomicrobium sp.]
MKANEWVFVVDDDRAARESLEYLLTSVGYRVCTFTSANEFLQSYDDRLGCVILDVRMPGMSGLQLQLELQKRHSPLASIVVTGHGDVPMAVSAMRHGAVDFLQKPFNDQVLLERTEEALARARGLYRAEVARSGVDASFNKLTCREREVAWLIYAGMPNKRIATELSLSCKTVEVHRANVMAKMSAQSVVDLVQKLGVLVTPKPS